MSRERSNGSCSQGTAFLLSISSCLFTVLFGTLMVVLEASDVLELLKEQGGEGIETKRI